MQNVTRKRAALMPTIARTRRHLATQKQGDWTAVAARDYASHRQTFQAAYARDCWRRLSSRPAVTPVVARVAEERCTAVTVGAVRRAPQKLVSELLHQRPARAGVSPQATVFYVVSGAVAMHCHQAECCKQH